MVRISDIIAYLGKDRQDAERARIISGDRFEGGVIGSINAELINNLVVNIVENSYGKPYIQLDDVHFEALKQAKAENYALIYKNKTVQAQIDSAVRPMMTALYDKLLGDLIDHQTVSPIFTHHIDYVNQAHYARKAPYESSAPDQIVVDYIAGMTDDYFVDLYAHCFPDAETNIQYIGYFD